MLLSMLSMLSAIESVTWLMVNPLSVSARLETFAPNSKFFQNRQIPYESACLRC